MQAIMMLILILSNFTTCYIFISQRLPYIRQLLMKDVYYMLRFCATLCKTVRPMLSDRCLSVCPVLCDIGVLRPNGWMDQDETWHAGRSRPWPRCVRWGPSSPFPKRGPSPSPIFGPCLLRPNGWMDRGATWYGGRPRPNDIVLNGDPGPAPPKGHSPQFSANVRCGQTADGLRCHLVRR